MYPTNSFWLSSPSFQNDGHQNPVNSNKSNPRHGLLSSFDLPIPGIQVCHMCVFSSAINRWDWAFLRSRVTLLSSTSQLCYMMVLATRKMEILFATAFILWILICTQIWCFTTLNQKMMIYWITLRQFSLHCHLVRTRGIIWTSNERIGDSVSSAKSSRSSTSFFPWA